jgi:hypothetical protein
MERNPEPIQEEKETSREVHEKKGPGYVGGKMVGNRLGGVGGGDGHKVAREATGQGNTV